MFACIRNKVLIAAIIKERFYWFSHLLSSITFQVNEASVSEMTFHARIGVIFIDASQGHLDFVWDKGSSQSHFIMEWLYVTNDFEMYSLKLMSYITYIAAYM